MENFDISKISLSYNEKKLIQERFAHLMNLEKIKNSQARPLLTDELAKTQEKFVDLQKENISLIETLANMKQHELELMKEVADILSSSTQKHQVEKILGEAKINQLQVSITNQVIKESEMTKTSHVKKALTEVSGYIDELVLKKEENSK